MVSGLGYIWFLIAGGIALGLLSGIIFLKNRNDRLRTLRRVQRQFGGISILAISPNAYFCGMRQSWDGQWCGTGVLMLTEEMLYFRLTRRNLDLSIPVDRVQNVITGDRFGRWLSQREYLQVTYQSVDGQVRIATWTMKKPQDLMGALQAVLGRKHQHGKAEEKHLPQNEDASGCARVMGG